MLDKFSLIYLKMATECFLGMKTPLRVKEILTLNLEIEL